MTLRIHNLTDALCCWHCTLQPTLCCVWPFWTCSHFHLQGSVWYHSLCFSPTVKITHYCGFPISKAHKQDFAPDHSKKRKEKKKLWLQTKLPASNPHQAQPPPSFCITGGNLNFFSFLPFYLTFSQAGAGVWAVTFCGSWVVVNTGWCKLTCSLDFFQPQITYLYNSTAITNAFLWGTKLTFSTNIMTLC